MTRARRNRERHRRAERQGYFSGTDISDLPRWLRKTLTRNHPRLAAIDGFDQELRDFLKAEGLTMQEYLADAERDAYAAERDDGPLESEVADLFRSGNEGRMLGDEDPRDGSW